MIPRDGIGIASPKALCEAAQKNFEPVLDEISMRLLFKHARILLRSNPIHT
jgi:hypothetical protein